MINLRVRAKTKPVHLRDPYVKEDATPTGSS
jgi:hypothetical protein